MLKIEFPTGEEKNSLHFTFTSHLHYLSFPRLLQLIYTHLMLLFSFLLFCFVSFSSLPSCLSQIFGGMCATATATATWAHKVPMATKRITTIVWIQIAENVHELILIMSLTKIDKAGVEWFLRRCDANDACRCSLRQQTNC